MIKIPQYKVLYPGDRMYHCMSELYPGILDICEGMLQFTDDSACCWGGPFDGNLAYFSLQDYTKAIMPYGKNKGENLLTVWDKGYIDSSEKRDRPSVGKPIRLYMAGNDDTSYSKFYASELEAQEELNLFIGNQPLDFHDVVQDFDFVFTN